MKENNDIKEKLSILREALEKDTEEAYKGLIMMRQNWQRNMIITLVMKK